MLWKSGSHLRRIAGAGFAWGLAVATAVVAVGLNLPVSTVFVDVHSGQPMLLGLIYGTEDGASKRILQEVQPRVVRYRMTTPGLKRSGSIELSFSTAPGTDVLLARVELRQPGRPPVVVDGPDLSALSSKVEDAATVKEDEDALSGSRFVAGDRKVRLRVHYRLPRHESRVAKAMEIAQALPGLLTTGALLGGAVWLAVFAIRRWRVVSAAPATVPTAIVVALILAMALGSGFNAHPDEVWHFSAGGYYMTNIAAPALDDPVVAGTYSSFRHTYLEGVEIVYMWMGRFMDAGERIFGQSISLPMLARVFQAGLFAALGLYLAARGARRLPWLLLCSAQLWYVFAYANSDAFAFALGAILAFESGSETGVIRRALRGLPGVPWAGLVGLAVAAGALLFCKKSFFLLIPFLGLLGLASVLEGLRDSGSRRRSLVSAILLGAVAIMAAGALWKYDTLRPTVPVEANALPVEKSVRPDADEKIREITALRQGGVSLGEMVFARGWLAETSASFFGVFGWMTARAPAWIYWLAAGALGTMSTLIFLSALRRPDVFGRTAVVAGILAVCMSVALSVYWSWTITFQPQGRYLFPILIVVGTVWEMAPGSGNDRLTLVLARLLWILGVAIFLFLGIHTVDLVNTGEFM